MTDYTFNDDLYKECLKLSMNSGSDVIRFGSLLLKNKKVIGRGWNRLAKKEFPINMGYANHAEVMAMNDALLNNLDIKGGEIYVGGYFPSDNTLYVPKEAFFTCTRCPIYFEKYGIEKISVHSYSGWEKLSLNQARNTAKKFMGNTHEKRINLGKSSIDINVFLSGF